MIIIREEYYIGMTTSFYFIYNFGYYRTGAWRRTPSAVGPSAAWELGLLPCWDLGLGSGTAGQGVGRSRTGPGRGLCRCAVGLPSG
jgi:hypothetical protein